MFSTALNSTVNTNPATAMTKDEKALLEADPQKIQERFIALLTAQMKNQDPLAPADNNQITTQMSQLSTVTGIANMNKNISDIGKTLESTQTLNATGLLGRAVLTEGNELRLVDSKGAQFAFDLASDAQDVSVTIKDVTGRVVAVQSLGSGDSGINEFTWDGTDQNGQKAPFGKYTFEVESNSGGNKVSAKELQRGEVLGVTRSAEGPVLRLANGTTVKFSDVIGVN